MEKVKISYKIIIVINLSEQANLFADTLNTYYIRVCTYSQSYHNEYELQQLAEEL